MKLLTYQKPEFTPHQLKMLEEERTLKSINFLSNAFQLINLNYSEENMARPKSRQVKATAIQIP